MYFPYIRTSYIQDKNKMKYKIPNINDAILKTYCFTIFIDNFKGNDGKTSIDPCFIPNKCKAFFYFFILLNTGLMYEMEIMTKL